MTLVRDIRRRRTAAVWLPKVRYRSRVSNTHGTQRGARALGMALAGWLSCVPAGAQEISPTPAETRGVEVTPFIAVGSPEKSLLGAALAIPLTDALSIEAEVGYRAHVQSLASDLSLRYTLPTSGRRALYVAGGIGLRKYADTLSPPQRPGDDVPIFATFLSPTLNVGLGLRVPVGAGWSYRVDARWYTGLGANAGEHWRLFHGFMWAK